MKKGLRYLIYSLLFFLPAQLLAQTPVTLPSGTNYTENFDGMFTSGAYPPGFVVNLSASSTSIGTNATSLELTPNSGTTATSTNWGATGNGIKNFASNDALPATTIVTDQAAATNRALGVRQTSGTGYDPGTAFVFQIANTTNKKNFKLTFNLQSLDATSTRTVTWLVDYGLGVSPTTFTPATTTGTLTTGASLFSNNAISVDFGNALDNQTGVVTIRVVSLTASGNPASGNRPSSAIDDFSLTWSVPTLTTTPTTLDFGTAQAVNTTSASQTITVTGANLLAGATIAVTGPYTVSTTGTAGSFASTAAIASAFTTGTIYVQFTPTTTTVATGTVTIKSTGATDATVSLTGTGAALAPTLTATPTSLAFGNVNQGVPSVKTYTLSGANLGTNSATVTATAPYSLSKSNGGPFTQTLTFTPAELTATTAPTVYVQFNPTTNTTSNGTITNTDPDVTAGPSVTVTGTGVAPAITAATTPATSPTSIDFSNQTILTSATKSYTLSGANLIAGSTTTVTSTGNTAYTVSKTNGSGYAASITFTAAEIAANPTVYVRFSPITLGVIAGSISNTTTGTGATSATVTLTGTSVAAPVPLLVIAPTSLTYSATVGTTSAAQSYTLTGTNISGATTVTVAAPYSISKTVGGTYGTSVAYTTADFPAGTGTQTVFIQFSPTVVAIGGVNNGTAVNATAGGSSQTLTLNGTGIGVPALSATPATLTFSQIINTTGTQTFSLSGVYLTANATLAATGAYTISKDGATFGTSLTYTPAELATAQTVTVKFAPTTLGASNGSITLTSTNAATQTVTLNGTGLDVPALTVNPTAITLNQVINSASAPQTYILSGVNLIGSTTVTSTAPFLISKDNITYASTLTYSTSELATAQTVYVKFTPTALVTTPGTITHATTGGVSKIVSVTGNGINSAPTLNAIADVTQCYTATPQVIALSGITPGLESTQITVVSVTTDNAALFSQIGILPLTTSTSQINYAFAANTTGTANVTVTVRDNGGTANTGTDTYTRTFAINENALSAISITSDLGNTIEKGQTINLTATGGVSYVWASSSDITSVTNTATVTVRPKASATYSVTATNAFGCTTTQTFAVTVINAKKLLTSNIITPNGDGINDTWTIYNIDLYPGNTVRVYNKAGKLVYTKSGYQNDWNGYVDGQPLQQGTYYYVVDLGSGLPYKGYITLLRD